MSVLCCAGTEADESQTRRITTGALQCKRAKLSQFESKLPQCNSVIDIDAQTSTKPDTDAQTATEPQSLMPTDDMLMTEQGSETLTPMETPIVAPPVASTSKDIQFASSSLLLSSTTKSVELCPVSATKCVVLCPRKILKSVNIFQSSIYPSSASISAELALSKTAKLSRLVISRPVVVSFECNVSSDSDEAATHSPDKPTLYLDERTGVLHQLDEQEQMQLHSSNFQGLKPNFYIYKHHEV